MKHSVIKIMGQQSMIMLLSVLVLLGSNNISAQNDEVVVKYNYKQTNKEHKIRERDAFTDMKIEHKGDIKVSDDDTKVLSISPGGYLKIYKKTFGNKRGIEIKSINGKLEFDYYLGKKKTAFEPEGREWLAEILLDVIRKTGIDAQRRTIRIYKKGGISAVLEEIHQLFYDNVKNKYYHPLLAVESLSTTDYTAIAKSINDELSYDSSKRKLLNNLSTKFLQSDESSKAFFSIIVNMSYDSEKNKILRNLEISKLTKTQKSGYLKAVSSMSYDSEKSKALIAYNSTFHNNKTLSVQYFTIVKRMSYDSESSKILNDLLEKQKLNQGDFTLAVVSLKSFSYDSEVQKVQLKINSKFSAYQNIDAAYFSVFENMSYDSYKEGTLSNLLAKAELNDKQMISVFKVLTNFSYDSYSSKVLLNAIPKMSLNNNVVDAFFATIKTMSYDSEMEKVVSELIEKPNLTQYAVSAVLKSVSLFSYDSSKVRILKSVKKYVNGKPDLQNQFKIAVKEISSDSEYRSLMSEID